LSRATSCGSACRKPPSPRPQLLRQLLQQQEAAGKAAIEELRPRRLEPPASLERQHLGPSHGDCRQGRRQLREALSGRLVRQDSEELPGHRVERGYPAVEVQGHDSGGRGGEETVQEVVLLLELEPLLRSRPI